MIPLISPKISYDSVESDLRKILESGQLTSGLYVARFEQAIASYAGSNFAVATTSATTALHLTLEASKIGSGDEVLVSDFSFPASGNVIVQVGATPVFVDCFPGRFDMDPADLERRITPKCKAIMVVHPFGQPADMSKISEIAARHNLLVIEDAACALGAREKDRMCGSIGAAGCYSFHPRKLLSTGEGGMIVTNDQKLHELLLLLRSHGSVRLQGEVQFVENGFNYRMTEIQAALGLGQLPEFDRSLIERRRLARLYIDLLSEIPNVNVPLSADIGQCTFQSFVVLLDTGVNGNSIISGLRSRGIEATIGTFAMHSHGAFERFGYRAGDLPHSMAAQCQSLTLPLFSELDDDSIGFVVRNLKDLIQAN